MRTLVCSSLFVSTALLYGQTPPREAVYGGAVILGGQTVPRFDQGYLVYLHQPKRLQVFGPDTQLAYEMEVSCPAGVPRCGAGGFGVSRAGVVAIQIGYPTGNTYASGILLLDPKGHEIRFFLTGNYVADQFAFDKDGNLWTVGWERDPVTNSNRKEPFQLVHKYSAEGKPLGEYLSSSLWNSRISTGMRGYWTMYAAKDRIGVMVNEHFDGRVPEWVEWDLNGRLLQRTLLMETPRLYSRGYAGTGQLYAQFPVNQETQEFALRMLDKATGKWTPVQSNLPAGTSAFLLGADGEDLVYRLNGGGNVHLIWARPE